MRTMVDSTNIADDPLNAQLVAYYVDGIYATTEAAVRARFPTAVLVPISAIGTDVGKVGDVEPGCMSPAQSVGWVQMRRRAGIDPTLYVNETYGWGPLVVLFRALGVSEPHWWVANYDGIAEVPLGAVAKQYQNPPLTHGHFDRSVALDFWPGVDEAHGPGSGSLTSRRVTTMAAAKSLHQWVRGTDKALYHRRRSGGTWSLWTSLGGVLGSDVITPGIDEAGVIVVSILGTDAKFYDYTSSDDGLTWSHPVNNGGGGDGMVAMSASQAAASGPVDLSPTGSLAWVKTSLDTVAGDAQTIRQRIEKDLAP